MTKYYFVLLAITVLTPFIGLSFLVVTYGSSLNFLV
jgi:hypothetical protein